MGLLSAATNLKWNKTLRDLFLNIVGIWMKISDLNCLGLIPSLFTHPQTACLAPSMRTWRKKVGWKESALCTYPLPSPTRTQMPSTCGTRTTWSSPWLTCMRAHWPALWCPSSHTYLHSFPPPWMWIARPTTTRSRGRVMHETAWRIQDSFHVVHLLLTVSSCFDFPL